MGTQLLYARTWIIPGFIVVVLPLGCHTEEHDEGYGWANNALHLAGLALSTMNSIQLEFHSKEGGYLCATNG